MATRPPTFRPGGPQDSSPRRQPWDLGWNTQAPDGATEAIHPTTTAPYPLILHSPCCLLHVSSILSAHLPYFFPRIPIVFSCSRTIFLAMATSSAPSPAFFGCTSKAVRQSSAPGR